MSCLSQFLVYKCSISKYWRRKKSWPKHGEASTPKFRQSDGQEGPQVTKLVAFCSIMEHSTFSHLGIGPLGQQWKAAPLAPFTQYFHGRYSMQWQQGSPRTFLKGGQWSRKPKQKENGLVDDIRRENTCNKQAGTKGWRFCESQGRQKYFFLSLLKYLQADRVQGAWRNLSDATYSQHHIFHIKLFCNCYGTYVSLPTLNVRPLHHVSFTNVTTSGTVWLALNS